MDIKNLKRECNLLIDEVMRLQAIEKALDLRITELQEEKLQLTETAGTMEVPEEVSIEEEAMPEDSVEKTVSDVGNGLEVSFCEEEPPELPAGKDKLLTEEITLQTGKTGKDVMIIYEPSQTMMTLRAIGSILMLVLLLAVVGAAVIFLAMYSK